MWVRAVKKLNSNIGVSHSVSRENPNSNAVRGSSSSSARNKLSSISFYLLIAILINIIFIQCNFWFKLFEWRRYVTASFDWIAAQMQSIEQEQPEQQELQHEQQQHQPQQQLDQHSESLPTIILGRFFTMPYFWFCIRHSFQWPLFIWFNLCQHLVQLFIQGIYLNCTCVAYAMAAAITAAAAAAKASVTQPIKSDSVAANTLCSPTELFIKNHGDYDKFTGIYANGMNLDHALFSRDAANQQTIIQNKQTDQL